MGRKKRNIGIPSEESVPLKRPPRKKHKSSVKRPGNSKSGWYNESYRHHLSALGIANALNPDTPKFKTPTKLPETVAQGEEEFYNDFEPSELQEIYVDELHDSLNDNNEKLFSGEISPEEHDLRQEIIILTANYVHKHGKHMTANQLSDLMRRSRAAQKGKDVLLFYWDIGEIKE